MIKWKGNQTVNTEEIGGNVYGYTRLHCIAEAVAVRNLSNVSTDRHSHNELCKLVILM